MKTNNAEKFLTFKRAQVLPAAGGTAVKVDIVSGYIDEVHIWTPVPIRWTWAKTDVIAAANLADPTKSCASLSGGEWVRHCRRMRQGEYYLYFTADGALASTYSIELGQYHGTT